MKSRLSYDSLYNMHLYIGCIFFAIKHNVQANKHNTPLRQHQNNTDEEKDHVNNDSREIFKARAHVPFVRLSNDDYTFKVHFKLNSYDFIPVPVQSAEMYVYLVQYAHACHKPCVNVLLSHGELEVIMFYVFVCMCWLAMIVGRLHRVFPTIFIAGTRGYMLHDVACSAYYANYAFMSLSILLAICFLRI